MNVTKLECPNCHAALDNDYENAGTFFCKFCGQKMIVEAIHAGVECGLFVDSIEGLDAVSFGPNIFDIHTPKERLDVASVARTWDFILATLRTLK